MSAIERGAVVEYPALLEFESCPRPYLVRDSLVDRAVRELATLVGG